MPGLCLSCRRTRKISSVKTFCTALLLVLALICIWVLVDPSLDEETKEWLEGQEGAPIDRRLVKDLEYRVNLLMPQWKSSRQICVGRILNQACLDWVKVNQEQVSKWVPGAGYFELYDQIVTHDRIQFYEPGKLDAGPGQAFIEATYMVVMRDIVSHGRVLPLTVAKYLLLHRYHLAQAHSLVDWAYFAASTGILVDAASNAVQRAHPNEFDLSSPLSPLTRKEMSLNDALQGEFRYGSSMMIADTKPWSKPNYLLNMMRKGHQKNIDDSELDRSVYWRSTFEPYRPTLYERIEGGLVGWLPLIEIAHPAYVNYHFSLRMLDTQLALVRGLAASELPTAPPGWDWKRHKTTVCLVADAGNLAARNQDAMQICTPIFSS